MFAPEERLDRYVNRHRIHSRILSIPVCCVCIFPNTLLSNSIHQRFSCPFIKCYECVTLKTSQFNSVFLVSFVKYSSKREIILKSITTIQYRYCISQWPRGLRRTSAAARMLRLRVRLPPWACLSVVSVVCCQVEVSATG